LRIIELEKKCQNAKVERFEAEMEWIMRWLRSVENFDCLSVEDFKTLSVRMEEHEKFCIHSSVLLVNNANIDYSTLLEP
jgi:hypothetical protein